jgi:predicted dinucleotide-binding enzyme
MKIGLFGAGNVGGALGTSWVKAGHDVFFGVKDPAAKDTQALVSRLGSRARAGTLQEAASFGEVVVIALPWQAAFDALPKLNVSGKVVIDCSNPPAALPGGAVSGVEALARLAPGAKFAKAFNIIDGTKLHYVRGGSGCPVMLLHGYPETSYAWRKIPSAGPDNARTTRAPDLTWRSQSSCRDRWVRRTRRAVA